MREILYVQAGSFANFVGTHFWNTQESYFTYGNEAEDDPIVSHDISFREGITNQKEPILSPRLLVFDRKANFGTLAKNNALFEDENVGETPALWNGSVAEYRQDPVKKSRYQEHLDNENQEDDENKDGIDSEVRYWSDFNRVYYLPRTIQQLPDVAEWENVEGDWNSGQETFRRYNEETELMDEAFRLFVEECDSLQGIQIINDTATFGSFVDAFLTSFRDEFSKLSTFSFPILSDAIPGEMDVDDVKGIRKAISDATFLRNLNELSSINVPILSPLNHSKDAWSDLEIDWKNIYHTSAVVSAAIETATLPLRLKVGREELSSLSSHLNWQGTTRFAELSTTFPLTSLPIDQSDHRMCNFSMYPQVGREKESSVYWFARKDVLRGFDEPDIKSYEGWCENLTISEPLLSSVRAPAYPIPTSFPSFFKTRHLITGPRPRRGIHATPAIKMWTSLTTSTHTSNLISKYATFVDDCVRRKSNVEDLDELRELGSDLWNIVDLYGDGGSVGEAVDELGEDE